MKTTRQRESSPACETEMGADCLTAGTKNNVKTLTFIIPVRHFKALEIFLFESTFVCDKTWFLDFVVLEPKTFAYIYTVFNMFC